MDIVKQTVKEIVEKYGSPEEKIINGTKYKFINTTLLNFNKLRCIFYDFEKLQGKPLTENQIAIMCDFAKTEIQVNVENVISKLQTYRRGYNKKYNNYEKKIQILFDDLDKFYASEKYNKQKIMDIFVTDIDCVDFRAVECRIRSSRFDNRKVRNKDFDDLDDYTPTF